MPSFLKYFIPALFILCFLSCDKPAVPLATIDIPKQVVDRHPSPYSSATLAKADQLRWERKYTSAIPIYEEALLEQKDWPLAEIAYAYNQYIYALIQAGGKMDRVEKELDAFYSKIKGLDLKGIARGNHCYNLAFHYLHIGEGQKAIPLLEEALGIYEEQYPDGHFRMTEVFVLLSEAIYYYSQKPNILEATFHYLDEAAEIINRDSNLISYAHRYFYWDAFVGFMRRQLEGGVVSAEMGMAAVIGNPEIRDSLFLAKCMVAKGVLLNGQGKKAEAFNYFQEAVAIGEAQEEQFGDHLQFFYKELILFFISQQDEGSFNKWIQRAEKRFSSFKYMQPLRLNAKWDFSNGNQEQALIKFQKIIQLLDQGTWKNNTPKLYDEAYFLLGRLYRQKNMSDSSIYFIKKSMALGTFLYQKGELNWNDIRSDEIKEKSIHSFLDYGILADTYFQEYGNKKNNLSALQKTIELYFIADSLLFNNALLADKSSSLNFLFEIAANYYPNAIQCSHELFQKTKEPNHIANANFFIERQKSFLFYQAISSTNQRNFDNNNYPIQKKEKEIREEIKKLKWKKEKRKGASEEINRNIHQLSQNLIDLYGLYKKEHPLFFAKKMQHQITSTSKLKEIAQEEQSILQYHIGPEKIHLISISNKDLYFLQWEKPDSFAIVYDRYISLLSNDGITRDKKYFQQLCGDGHQLYQWLIAPAKISTKEILIVPDASYKAIPFDALIKTEINKENKPDYASLNYLGNDQIISYTSSLKTYCYNQEEKRPMGKAPHLLAFSYSDLSKKQEQSSFFRDSSLSELRGAAREVNNISKIFGQQNGQYYYGSDSKRNSFFREIQKNYDIVHLALHAAADKENPSNNRLFFRNPTDEKLAQAIHSFEISALQIETPLVVLSACATADGPMYEAEGTQSLSSAFMEAGAREVVSSLWDIPDFATEKIMSQFYLEIKNGATVEWALWKAKRAYLKDADQYLGFPGYWSGVVNWE